MNWRVEIRPEAVEDVREAALWYESKETGLGRAFGGEISRGWDALAISPLLARRRHPSRNVRWCIPKRFPYRVIYEVFEERKCVVVVTVLHAARHDRRWRRRFT